ncbi:MAG: alcohol dehydrogenase catalytic domain-containing protein [Archangium sp.]|nr:alcohol dehydrogenase catalytic domain-containing protein [Archangium sp.]
MPRVIQLLKPREAVEVVETRHVPPLAGEVTLRIEACALGQLDWNLLTLDAPPRLPLVPGHEAVGVVEAVGPGATLRPGDRVLVTPLASSCGQCAACRGHDARHCVNASWRGVHVDGALGTHLVTREQALVPLELPLGVEPLPEVLPRQLAAALALCGGSLWTAVGAVNALGLINPSRVGIFGVGGVGHLAVQVARALGHRVFATDADPDRMALARSLGAEPLDGPVDAAVVCTPSTQALQQAVRLLRAGGRVSLTGSSPTGRVDLSVADLVWRGLTLRSGLLGTREDLEESVSLIFTGKVKPIMELVSLDEVPARLWALRDLGFPGRLVVLPA